jgi:hypothetical protein
LVYISGAAILIIRITCSEASAMAKGELRPSMGSAAGTSRRLLFPWLPQPSGAHGPASFPPGRCSHVGHGQPPAPSQACAAGSSRSCRHEGLDKGL